MAAFDTTLPFGREMVIVGAILFGYSTILGWAYYGEKCSEFLLGQRAVVVYRCLFTLFVILGAVLELRVVWNIADIANALMALPNLIGLLLLSSLLAKETRIFLSQIRSEQLPAPQTTPLQTPH
jgi:AGCS family alanine or glycine:cation symporter